jgi:hypothetical protein
VVDQKHHGTGKVGVAECGRSDEQIPGQRHPGIMPRVGSPRLRR